MFIHRLSGKRWKRRELFSCQQQVFVKEKKSLKWACMGCIGLLLVAETPKAGTLEIWNLEKVPVRWEMKIDAVASPSVS